MTAMTNHTLPDRGATLSPELRALAPVGGKRRPVKVVEHPAFRAARAARAAFEAPYTVLRLPVVSLDPRAPETRVDCRALTCTSGAV
jgi:hypothetical protein